MIKIALYSIVLFSFFGCKVQESITLKYLGHRYIETKNESFINDELIFIKSKDTLRMNIKIPFDKKNFEIINRGVFYNCHLTENTEYTFILKKICINDIPKTFSSYYFTNAVFDKENCTKFTEIEKNTEYKYVGNYGKYVDINGVLYKIIGLTPSIGCSFHH